jgi:hypothetical protein
LGRVVRLDRAGLRGLAAQLRRVDRQGLPAPVHQPRPADLADRYRSLLAGRAGFATLAGDALGANGSLRALCPLRSGRADGTWRAGCARRARWALWPWRRFAASRNCECH